LWQWFSQQSTQVIFIITASTLRSRETSPTTPPIPFGFIAVRGEVVEEEKEQWFP